MSLALYDKAFVKKLNKITENTNIHVYSPDDTRRLFEIIADESDDKPLKLPIVCLRRQDGYTIREMGNNPRSKNSLKLTQTNDQSGSSIQLNVIPISINYQIDIFSRKLEEADAIAREMVFILTNSPSLIVTVPYNDIDLEHKSNVVLGGNVRDNSSISERLISGQFTRFTIDCSVSDAYLFDTRAKPYLKLSGDLLIKSPNGYNKEPINFGDVSLKV